MLCALPREIIRSIFLKLSLNDIIKTVTSINHQFHDQVSNEVFWKEYCTRYNCSSSGRSKPDNQNWQKNAFTLYITQEFIAEQASYYTNLEVLVTCFLIPLRKSADINSLPITPEEVVSMFYNVEMLYCIQKMIFPEIASIINMPPTEIAKTFNKFFPGLRFYNEYVRNWRVASDLFEKKTADDLFSHFLKDPKRVSYDLYSLLRAPVYCVPKMVAFLKGIFATTNNKDINDVTSKISNLDAHCLTEKWKLLP